MANFVSRHTKEKVAWPQSSLEEELDSLSVCPNRFNLFVQSEWLFVCLMAFSHWTKTLFEPVYYQFITNSLTAVWSCWTLRYKLMDSAYLIGFLFISMGISPQYSQNFQVKYLIIRLFYLSILACFFFIYVMTSNTTQLIICCKKPWVGSQWTSPNADFKQV